MIAERTKNIADSLTLAITSQAKKMKQDGINVVSFGAGEPDFDTPLHIKNAAKEAIDKGFTKYTPSSGTVELKKAIIAKLACDNNLHYTENEIIVGCGAKHVIYETILTLVNPQDEVIIPSPYWLSYPEMVRMAEGIPIYIPTEEKDNFLITPENLEKTITKRTKILILNSPSNPTGSIYQRKTLEQLAKIIEQNNIICISDEIYEKLVYDTNTHTSIASLSDKIKKQTIVINGVSKAYSMTGWRIGYAAGDAGIISVMKRVQDHSTSNPTSIAQKAAEAALLGSQDEIEKMRLVFEKRRNLMLEKIREIKSISCPIPQGAFYCFVNIGKLYRKQLKTIDGSLAFAKILLEKKHVAVIPGIVFGDDNFIRLSYAISEQTIIEGLNRIREFIEEGA